MMIKKCLLLVFIFCSLIPVAAQTPPDFADQLDAAVPGQLAEYAIPGAAIALIENGEVTWVNTYGVADIENQTPLTPDTLFHVASISKAMTAWAILHYVEQGVLDLDAPVDTYLTRWHIQPGRYSAEDVTLRRILSHTAGLSAEGFPGIPPDEPLPSLEELLTADVRVSTRPGLLFRYSGGGYTVLQLLLEEITGKSYAEVMQETVFDPLGMTNSTYLWTPELNVATPYERDQTPSVHAPLYTAQAAGGLYTTVEDLAKFVAAHMALGEDDSAGRGIISLENITLATSPAETTEDSYGFGYFIQMLPDGNRVAWHDGFSQGWRTLFAFIPSENRGIVILTNSQGGYRLMREVVCNWANHEEYCNQVRGFEG